MILRDYLEGLNILYGGGTVTNNMLPVFKIRL